MSCIACYSLAESSVNSVAIGTAGAAAIFVSCLTDGFRSPRSIPA